MGVCNFKGVKMTEERQVYSHIVVFGFPVHRLDVTQRKFRPLEYNIQCPTVPTSWEIELRCERLLEDNGAFTILATLKRKDSGTGVKASLCVAFIDGQGNYVLREVSENRNGVELEDVLRCSLNNIPPGDLRKVVLLRVTILIENCHSRASFLCASKFNTSKNSKYLSKL